MGVFYMKSLFLCTMTFVCTLGAAPKVVAQWGSTSGSEQLRQEVWNSSMFQALLEENGIEREEKEGSTPLLTVYAEDGEEVGSVGYLVISPEKYVDLFKEMLATYTLCHALSPLSAEQLLPLYRKAQLFHMTACQEKILREGLAKDSGVEFLIEQYAHLVKKHPRKAQKIKEEIRSRKPSDAATEWELALLSFQAKRETTQAISKVVLPLKKFLRRYGNNQEYSWRCHLVLAEFYKGKHKLEEARRHAVLAGENSPSDLKEMLQSI